jgi:hypothetical protein
MWKVYLRSANLISRKDRIIFSNLNLKNYDNFGGKSLSRSLATQEEILSTNLKQPLKKDNPNQKDQQNSKQSSPKEKNSNFKKFFGIFTSGALSYFAISFYLERNKSSSQGINYESNSLPGKIAPSKSVKFYYFTYYFHKI